MDNLIEAMMKQVATPGNLSAISKSVGGNEKGVQSALAMGLPMLLSSMSKSASTPSGAATLTKMINQNDAKNPLNDLGGFLGGGNTATGSNMVQTLLGGQMSGIQNAISQKTGLPPAAVGKVLAIATPIVLGQVSKMFMGKDMDSVSLSKFLGEQSNLAVKASPDAASLVKQFSTPEKEEGGLFGWLKKLGGGAGKR